MSTTGTEVEAAGTGAHPAGADAHEEHHFSERDYVKVFAVLVVLTAVEVALSYIEVGNKGITNGLLLVLMAIKFFAVAAFFMHLKFDSLILRRLFITGIILATIVYFIVFLSFGLFI